MIIMCQKGSAIRPNGAEDAEALEHEICIGLPLGSPRSAADSFLGKRGLEFSFDGSPKVYAVAGVP